MANTLHTLAILHIARLLADDPTRVADCAALLRHLDPPPLSSRIFQDVYRAKVGSGVQLTADTADQMWATMERMGDGNMTGWPKPDVVFSQGTGALLARANPAAFLFRFSLTARLGGGILPRWIEFLQKGGQPGDINTADVRSYHKILPPAYDTSQTFGLLRFGGAGVSDVVNFMKLAREPDSPLLMSALDGPRRPTHSRFQVTERVIGKVKGFEASFQMGISPDALRFHLIEQRVGGQVLVTERGQSRLYDQIHAIRYNTQSTRLAFVARRAGQELLVVDGVEGQPYDSVRPDEVQFSPDGRHLAFLGIRGGQYFVVADGRESAAMPDVIGLTYSPSQQLAWMVRRNGLWSVEYGGQQSAGYPGVNGPFGITFSPDGRSWAYQVVDAQGQRLNILEGARTVAYPGSNWRDRPVFSPDGSRVLFRMYVPDSHDLNQVQLADTRGQAFPETIRAGEVFFSPDLQRRAAVDLVGGAAGGRRTYQVTREDRRWNIEGVNTPTVVFGPHGKRFVVRGDTMLLDGKEVANSTGPWGEAIFSPDSGSFAHIAQIRTEPYRDIVMRDDQEIQSFPSGGTPRLLAFSPDSRHLAYVAPHGVYVALAVDGEEAASMFDSVPFNSRLVFDAPNRFHTIAVRNGEVMLVAVSWSE